MEPVTEDEIKKALFSISNEKAPGPDGYSALFFKQSWEVVKVDVILAARRFFEKCSLPKYVNSILLALIPKKCNAAEMKDYRPISCCNVMYKVISKVLANRLSKVLPNLISPAQTAFIKGRNIGDGILLAHELLKGYNRSGISPCCAMKIDLMKAFDSVEWDFVFETLKSMNFPAQFVDWIAECFHASMLSVNVNGTSMGYFPAKRGLRQGDPISPYLFVISMEVLSCLFEQSVTSKRYHLHPQCKGVSLTHLSFADDLLVFSKANKEAVEEVTAILNKFHQLSGLRFNPDKSNIYTAGIDSAMESELVTASGFCTGILPFRYLGVPLNAGKLRKCDCKTLVDQITSRVTDWKAKHLSYAGKCQLIEAVIGGTMQYWMSHFILPSGVVKEVERICNDFLWGKAESKSRAKVAWQTVSKPKLEGGLGLKDMRTWNKANVVRHIWNVLLQEGSLWVAWINKYRLKGRCFSQVRDTSGSWHWSKLLKLRTSVEQYIEQDDEGGWLWNGKYMEKYKVSSVWNDLRPTGQIVPWYDVVWSGYNIPRRAVVTWLIVINRIYTKDKVSKWNSNVDERCVMCMDQRETRDHLFVQCSYTAQIVSNVLPAIVRKAWDDVLQTVSSWKTSGTAGKARMLLWRVMVCQIWIERCRRVFGGISKDANTLAEIVRDAVRTFALGKKDEREIIRITH
ncbi:LINE-1 retrotransposable element ORF2 protein [Linum perenne]